MSAGLGPGSTGMEPAQPRHDAAPRPSAAPGSPQSAGVAAGDGTDGPEPSRSLASPRAELFEIGYRAACRTENDTAITDVTLADEIRACLAAVLPAHEAMVRQRVAEEIEAVRLEWNDEEPEGPNGCCDADVHNCHRDAGERTFAEAIRIARGGQA